MLLKLKKRYFISRALAALFSVEWNHLCNFGRRHHQEQFCKIYFEFGPVIQEETLFKDISYLELWWAKKHEYHILGQKVKCLFRSETSKGEYHCDFPKYMYVTV